MAVILRNKYYLYSLRELLGAIVEYRGGVGYPCIKFKREEDYLEFKVDICGKTEKFYIKKGTLKKYELQSIYHETFQSYKINGHCYIRPEVQINKGDIVVDAGGCEGYYARYALNMGAHRVIIFEPCKELAQGLRKTFDKEIDTGNVLIIEKALGRGSYKNKLYINQNMLCASSTFKNDENIVEQDVFTVSLDEILEEYGIKHIDIVKMDIEGAEVDAVMGMEKIIRSCHPKMMIATYHAYYNAIKICRICKKIYSQYKCSTYGCYPFEIPFRPYMTFLR